MTTQHHLEMRIDLCVKENEVKYTVHQHEFGNFESSENIDVVYD